MLPLGAAIVAFFAVAVPAILLMTVWAGVMAFRLLFPEQGLPAHQRSNLVVTPGRALATVRYRDIAEDVRTHRPVATGGGEAEKSPWARDLWERRN